MQANGEIACEACGLIPGKNHFDHTIADGLQIDKSRRLTADDGKLLGAECRHAPKAKVDVAVIAEAKRREAKFHDFSRPKQTVKSPGLAKSEKAAKQCRTRDCRNCRDGRFTRGLSRE
ncbi:hypothetical protein ACLJYM_18950 [Rhizobium giardinii]|uniref:hypothetical protein n=1 Tax=Rhizobium giardinii TaxID=56731 RepID=UPI0039E02D3D